MDLGILKARWRLVENAVITQTGETGCRRFLVFGSGEIDLLSVSGYSTESIPAHLSKRRQQFPLPTPRHRQHPVDRRLELDLPVATGRAPTDL